MELIAIMGYLEEGLQQKYGIPIDIIDADYDFDTNQCMQIQMYPDYEINNDVLEKYPKLNIENLEDLDYVAICSLPSIASKLSSDNQSVNLETLDKQLLDEYVSRLGQQDIDCMLSDLNAITAIEYNSVLDGQISELSIRTGYAESEILNIVDEIYQRTFYNIFN